MGKGQRDHRQTDGYLTDCGGGFGAVSSRSNTSSFCSVLLLQSFELTTEAGFLHENAHNRRVLNACSHTGETLQRRFPGPEYRACSRPSDTACAGRRRLDKEAPVALRMRAVMKNDEVAAGFIARLGAEKATENRDVAENRNLRRAIALGPAR